MIKKLCLNCGNEFTVVPKRSRSAKFCTLECKHAIGRANKECLFCGKKFQSQKNKKRKYCSYECANNARKRRVTKICQTCGKEYEVQNYAQASKYCSLKCRDKGFSKTQTGRFRGEKSPNYGGKITKICAYCKNLFEVHPYRRNTANHCSIRCSKLDTSQETRKKIAESIKKLQKENPKIHPNYILAQKGHVTQLERTIQEDLKKRGLHFKRQYRILSYWIDFAFPEVKLAIECDGDRWHSTIKQQSKDWERDQNLCNHGWTVFRLTEQQILDNPEGCLEMVHYMLKRLKEIK